MADRVLPRAGAEAEVEADIVMTVQADRGGGLFSAQALAAICRRFTGTPGPEARVRVTDFDCPADLRSISNIIIVRPAG
ncbi:hypothetical protein ACOZ38_21060 [Sphaerisporangium viridialbum]|uniref:hypothetical protein n=1 Tax=Sphaerisporangium viridialbum TaxID=46189 RepID=UPI003C79520A